MLAPICAITLTSSSAKIRAMPPATLKEALAALRENALFREHFGDRFIDYILALKTAEVARFESEVTDWEHREYFDTL